MISLSPITDTSAVSLTRLIMWLPNAGSAMRHGLREPHEQEGLPGIQSERPRSVDLPALDTEKRATKALGGIGTGDEREREGAGPERRDVQETRGRIDRPGDGGQRHRAAEVEEQQHQELRRAAEEGDVRAGQARRKTSGESRCRSEKAKDDGQQRRDDEDPEDDERTPGVLVEPADDVSHACKRAQSGLRPSIRRGHRHGEPARAALRVSRIPCSAIVVAAEPGTSCEGSRKRRRPGTPATCSSRPVPVEAIGPCRRDR